MSTFIQRFVADLVPGERVDFDEFEPDVREELSIEITRLGMVIDSNGKLGEVSICGRCEGEGQLAQQKRCHTCDGFGQTVDFGRGVRPFMGE